MSTRQDLHDKALTHWLYYYLTLPALETYLVSQGWRSEYHPVTASRGRCFIAPVCAGDGQPLETYVVGPEVELPRQFRVTIELAAAIKERAPLDVIRDILAAAQSEFLTQLETLISTHRPEYRQ